MIFPPVHIAMIGNLGTIPSALFRRGGPHDLRYPTDCVFDMAALDGEACGLI